MALQITTEPLVEPISLIEARLHLRVSTTADDALITQLIRAARIYCENYQGRPYIARTYQMTFDDYFPGLIEPPMPPLCYVNSITYLDSDGASQTVTATLYTVDTVSEPGRIYEAYDETWPSSVRAVPNTIAVNYVAGYAAEFTVVVETNVFTVLGRTYTNGDKVRLSNSGDVLPTGLSVDTDYYIIEVSGNTFQLSTTSGGDAVVVTASAAEKGEINYVGEVPETAKAAMKLVLGHLYENRENTIETSLKSLPQGAEMLLIQDRMQW